MVDSRQAKLLSFGYSLSLKCSFVFMGLLYLICTFVDTTIIKLWDALYDALEKWTYQLGEMSGDIVKN